MNTPGLPGVSVHLLAQACAAAASCADQVTAGTQCLALEALCAFTIACCSAPVRAPAPTSGGGDIVVGTGGGCVTTGGGVTTGGRCVTTGGGVTSGGGVTWGGGVTTGPGGGV